MTLDSLSGMNGGHILAAILIPLAMYGIARLAKWNAGRHRPRVADPDRLFPDTINNDSPFLDY